MKKAAEVKVQTRDKALFVVYKRGILREDTSPRHWREGNGCGMKLQSFGCMEGWKFRGLHVRETRWEIGFRGLGSLGSKKKNGSDVRQPRWASAQPVALWKSGILGNGVVRGRGWYVGEAYGKYNIIMAIDNVKGYACLVLARV